jgi:thymidylate synthase (FAD)
MKNKVEFIGYYGSDEVIAQSAWTSTSRDLTPEKKERIPQLLIMLWSEGHETPFEKGIVHFLVDCDIASHIHLLKHRISQANAESARYKEIKEDKYYLPEDWDPIGKNLGLDEHLTLDTWLSDLEHMSKKTNEMYHKCLEDLTPILGRKRAKESARYFKMYNSQIQTDISFNLRSFANFLRLRKSEHAQKEIRDIAQQMFEIVQGLDNEPFKTALWVIDRANVLWEQKRKEISEQLKEEWVNK